MYEHIIVPFDGTAAALAAGLAATDLSERFGAELVLATAADLDEVRIEQFKAAAMDRSDHRVTVWVEPAHVEAEAIATVAAHRPNSLICMYSHARTGVRRAVYGSLAEYLLRHTDSPVLVFGPNWEHGSLVNLRNLIVCLDGTPTAEAAIPLAASWAQAMPLTAVVLHVDTGDAEQPAVDLARLAFPLEQCCAELERVTVPDTRPVEVIIDMAQTSTASMLVMATHGRAGFDRLMRGSLTAEVAQRSPIPVLIRRGPLPTERPAWLNEEIGVDRTIRTGH